MPDSRSAWSRAFVRNLLLALIPVAAVWWLATPLYNRLLLGGAQTLLHATESPDATSLLPRDDQSAYVQRRDFPPAKSLVHSFQVTDVHFHLVLVFLLFLAVPGVPWRRRLENLGWALLATVLFDLALVFFLVKAAYATRLGAWSAAHYDAFSRNVYGLIAHLLDLPFKLGLPFLLWAGCYLGDLQGRPPAEAPESPRPVKRRGKSR
ncbi:MAG TPA: hypothetical protein VN783_06865 [Thermoanaerobaculia bacterium]|nr:hypothetical protein [Thermoanaerobaculia bacterium]